MRSLNFYKKLIDRIKRSVRAARIPRSFSKKRNNVFSNEQHIVIQVLMQLEKKRLRDMPSFLALLQDELHLARAIHFTTINKFVKRVKQSYLEIMIARMVKSNEASLVAIDGTGFSLQCRSPYFCTIAGERNRFMQTNAAAEVKRRLIIAVRLRRKRRNENIDVPYLMGKTKQLKITAFLADKGYDSEKNHCLAEQYRSRFIAPIKNRERKKIYGFHRKRLAKDFPSEIYKQRVIIESIFSAVKRRFGHQIYARRFNNQRSELMFRIIAYNSEKLVNLSIVEVYFLLSTSLNKVFKGIIL